jgi:hypothetical protein
MSPVQGMLEIVKDVVFDTLFVPENLRGGKGHLFCIPLGQYAGRQIKQYEDTSMLMAGSLPSPHKFLVRSFHCYLFDPDGGLIALGDRAWDGTFALDISCKRVKECSLRDMADANISHIIRSETRDCKHYNVQELETPTTKKDVAEFEAAISGNLPQRKDLFLIETMEAFTGSATFDYPTIVPLKAVFAMNGILGRAVC